MQNILLFVAGISVFMSCTKNAGQASDQPDSPNLISIIGDSADVSFVYEDGKVMEVLARLNDGGYYYDLAYTPYARLSYDSTGYVKATCTDPYPDYAYTEYFLNEGKLPLRIIIHFNDGDAKDVVDFFYNPQTNLLDSVHDTNDGINFTSAHLQYDGADITGITTLKPYSDRIIKNFIEYSYDKAKPNVFKTVDPLWYIYKKPFGTLNAGHSWVERNSYDLAKLFSQNTFIGLYGSNYYNDLDTLYYTLNSAGRLETEWYSSVPHHIKYYNYSH